MNRSDVRELHYITPIANVASILLRGILSNTRVAEMPHVSLAMPEIQERRQNKRIPGGRLLHDYVNLYFDAHNPMLSKRRDQNNEICVLKVSSAILDLPGVVIADQNAATDFVRFYQVSEGLAALDGNRVFARSWIHPDDHLDTIRHKAKKCAEVLVPDQVDPGHIVGAYVANPTALARFQALNVSLTAQSMGGIFF